MTNSIMVLVEHLQGTVVDITYEMLGAGRKIAESLNVPLTAVVFGKDVNKCLSALGAADSVVLIEDERLEMPSPRIIAEILKSVFELKEASIMLMGGTNITAGIGPALAGKLKIPYLNFCKNISVEGGAIAITSQLFGGKILSNVNLTDGKCIISVYPGSFPIEAGKAAKMPPVEEFAVPAIEFEPTFKRYIEPEPGDVDITKESVLVSVGRGIENSDNISLAEDLISVLGGAVAASRPVIDQGWLPLSRQVGKSGMIVKPKLYFALGISGAPEHVEGMKDSELIVAINKDAGAPIFNVAHYGVCADLQDIVPVLVESLKNRN
jgi:electron transfer flavoprotein alpha subunit